MSDPPLTEEERQIYTLYESGKGRRYGLLFSVHGAALAIVSFLVKDAKNEIITGLFVAPIAIWMIIFTMTMQKDIESFGLRMAKLGGPNLDLFGKDGQRVLKQLSRMLIFIWIVVMLLGLSLAVK